MNTQPFYAINLQSAGRFLDGVPIQVPGNGPAQPTPIVPAVPTGKMITYNGYSLTTQIDLGQVIAAYVFYLSDQNNQLGADGWNNVAWLAHAELFSKDFQDYEALFPGDYTKGSAALPGTFAYEGFGSSFTDPSTGHRCYFDINKKFHDTVAEAAASTIFTPMPTISPGPGMQWQLGAFGWYPTPITTVVNNNSAAPALSPNLAAFNALSPASQTKLLGMVPVLGLV